MHSFARRHVEIKDKQRHRDGEDAVAEGRETFDAAAGESIIHRMLPDAIVAGFQSGCRLPGLVDDLKG